MPRRFTPGKLARMQAEQVSSLQDTCRIWRRAGAPGVDGYPESEYFPDPDITVCGLEIASARNLHSGDYTAPTWEARVRLPLDTLIGPLDRVEILTRYGVAVANETVFECSGGALPGPTGIVVNLTRITGWNH
jgi:hypothetical protein